MLVGLFAGTGRLRGLRTLLLVLPLSIGLGGCEFTGGIFSPGGIFGPPLDAPNNPTDPTNPVDPTDPTNPVDPTNPIEPTDPGTGDTGTITAAVTGTIIIAMDGNDRIVDVYDTSGRDPDLDRDGDGVPESFSVTLNGIPADQPIRIFIISDGELAPINFDDGSGSSNQLLLGPGGSINLGLLPKPASTGERVFSEFSPGLSADGSLTSAVSLVPAAVNYPDTSGLSLAALNRLGLGALQDGWLVGASHYFAAADALSTGDISNAADTARFFRALTRVTALAFDTLSDGDPSDNQRLGDLLDRFGFATDASRANRATLKPPLRLPSSAPRGSELQAFVHDVVGRELREAVADLDRVSAQFLLRVSLPGLGARSGPEQDQGVEADYGDVIALRSMFNFALALVSLQQAYDLDVDLAALGTTAGISLQSVVEQQPAFLSLKAGAGADLAAARGYFVAALDDAERALQIMQVEQAAGDDQQDELFVYADQSFVIPALLSPKLPGRSSLSFDTVSRLRAALSGPAEISVDSATAESVLLDLDALFRGIDLRFPTVGLLPAFDGNAAVGLLLDPTMQGMFGFIGFDPNRDADGDGNADILDGLNRFLVPAE